jgi:CheY-like chemotaxis protein
LSLPRVLLVDDSEAVLALQVAALSATCELATGHDGREGLAKARSFRPDAMVVDLSMPHMRGDELLQRMKRDPALSSIPVVVCSSETERKAECLRAGAEAFLGKPVDAEALVATVSRILAQARLKQQNQGLAVLFVKVGSLELGLPIAAVRSVLHQVATRSLPVGPAYLSEFAELFGEPVLVLDLARRFGLAHATELKDRKLVLIEVEGSVLSLCVDEVRDPEEISASALVRRERIGGAGLGAIALVAMARTERGVLAVIEPSALASEKMLRELRSAISGAA